MPSSVLQYARKLMKRRQFSNAISLLEENEKKYKGSFEYYLSLGTCCLYVGDFGNAGKFYEEARKIRVQNKELYLGQAVIFLHRGEIERSIQYYLDIQSMDSENKRAKEALEFIRVSKGDHEVIMQWFDSGKIERFYPPLGTNTTLIRNGILMGIIIGACISLGIVIGNLGHAPLSEKTPKKGVDDMLQDLQLTDRERLSPSTAKNSSETGKDSESNEKSVYVLSDDEINKTFDKALKLFQSEHDNAAHVELNRILNSNAVPSIRAKASDLVSLLREQTFDSLKDNYDYEKVEEDHTLYDECYVLWDGRFANMEVSDDGTMVFTLLVGYEDKKWVRGMVPVYFDYNPNPPLDTEKPIRILGKVSDIDGELVVYNCAYYQPIKEELPPLK